MKRTLLLLHGWGGDATIWDDMLAYMPGLPAMRGDRGYFGRPAMPPVGGPVLAIGHSLGAMLLADMLPPDIPLVAINGFDRFTGDNAVSPILIGRMQRRFANAPLEELSSYHTICGTRMPTDALDTQALADDLHLLATFASPLPKRRVLVLQGARDPILPAVLRDAVFPGAMRETLPHGGHALPISHAQWCADRIGAFACA